MNKKISALVLAFGLVQMSGHVAAEPMQSWLTPLNKMCFSHNGNIYRGVAAPGELKIIYGPYTAKCANTYHKFRLGLVLVNVQQLKNGVWVDRATKDISPAAQYGSGTFRVVIDNTKNQTPIPYSGGTFSVPL
ncbi:MULTISPECIES: hypothetical protein [unclassified Pseudomonas]|uniref:hypothetical protein n=1 Tax=unclassified Pseudomonas TaxID=196821 RepID=UPI002AC8BF8B|nr:MULTISPECIES: hypothetical protein [unclassified Pseudomonas]MEB0042740.1 hypothetical protein [Pseudomonas sp. MH10]MEB0079900.1 hypothetical protein [Pseudomonas sp. MH10out]MEB0093797.1 hypothetical protein [Pseudomonas sp. CCI4.2]MEB0103510.1 hypothetical protein [Pseudomonas sp. CCI3.2]MEB0121661.1 hypothetical protein [Pseudomonas sp. CCI1.2]